MQPATFTFKRSPWLWFNPFFLSYTPTHLQLSHLIIKPSSLKFLSSSQVLSWNKQHIWSIKYCRDSVKWTSLFKRRQRCSTHRHNGTSASSLLYHSAWDSSCNRLKSALINCLLSCVIAMFSMATEDWLSLECCRVGSYVVPFHLGCKKRGIVLLCFDRV